MTPLLPFEKNAPGPGKPNGALDQNFNQRSTTGAAPEADRAGGLPLKPPACANAPKGTSDVAADMIVAVVGHQCRQVYDVIAAAGLKGATDAEVEAVTGLRAQSVSPRRGELRALGLIVDSGERRPTPSGRPAAVWTLVRYADAGGGAA